MRPTSIVASVLVTCMALCLFAGELPSERRKAEAIAKADKLFGQRYSPPAGKPMRLYDEQLETGPADALIYWHGASYVVELVFGNDGSVSRVQLFPETLLHTDKWSDVPEYVEISRPDMEWLVESANSLRPLGKPGKVHDAPDGCFQSGPNLYCTDTYEQAVVSHYHIERGRTQRETKLVLRVIGILYLQKISGSVEDVRIEARQRQLKVRGCWYRGEKPGTEVFDNAVKGSLVRLITFGCAGNEKACLAVPDESKLTEIR